MNKFVDTLLAYLNWGKVLLRLMRSPGNITKAEGRNLLLLSWSFPPDFCAGTNRPTYFARYTPSSWKTKVIAAPQPLKLSEGGIQLLKILPSTMAIYRVERELQPIYRLLPQVDGGLNNAHSMVLKAIESLHGSPLSAILATGPRFTNFIAGYYLAQICGCKLILDYRDEWTGASRAFVQITQNDISWEKRCLLRADAVLFVSNGMRRIYIKHFPDLIEQKCHVIENGWDPEDFKNATLRPSSDIDREKFSISFIGRIGQHNLPTSFLKTFNALLKKRHDLKNRFKIYFLGKICNEGIEAIADFLSEYPELIEIKNEVPKFDALQFMCNSNALLLLNDSGDGIPFVGQKTYEYIATSKPILLYGTDEIQADIIRECKAGPVVRADSTEDLELALDQLLNKGVSHWLSPRRASWLAAHTREQQTKELFSKLDHLLEKTGTGT